MSSPIQPSLVSVCKSARFPAFILLLCLFAFLGWSSFAQSSPTSPPISPPTSPPTSPSALSAAAQQQPTTRQEDSDAPEEVYSVVNDQLIVWGTIITAVATMPALIDFLVERRKRKERIALSIDDVEVSSLQPRLAGMDGLLAAIADLIDRARTPSAYASLKVGNEMLIIGGSLSGKKAVAQRIAKQANLERLITVYNSRSPDALARAKGLIQSYKRQKVMLLLPRIDAVFEKGDDDLLAELEALVETASEQANVMVVGTAINFLPDSPLDNLFGIKLVLPGTTVEPTPDRNPNAQARKVLEDVARFYLDQMTAAGFRLDGLSDKDWIDRVLQVVSNAAEIEDVAVLCQTSAVFAERVGVVKGKAVTSAILEKSIGRVIVGRVGEV